MPDRTPHEPTPRFGDGPPPFAPPAFVPARAPGRTAGAPPAPPRPQWPLPRPHHATLPVRGAWGAAALAGAVALALYVWGAAPTVLSGDSAELAAAGFRGGVPHPTGYPTFVLLGRIAAAVLPGDPAHRITLMCAF